jgi:shikimate kinase
MQNNPNIFFVGPGSVGKTTVAQLLADALGYEFIDVDREFYARIAPIDSILETEGHAAYREKNSLLVDELVGEHRENTVIATPCGYLANQNYPHLAQKHLDVIKTGISVLLLPDQDPDAYVDVIVARQLARWNNLDAVEEKNRFLKNFQVYKNHGDIQILSMEEPETIVDMILDKLPRQTQLWGNHTVRDTISG